MVDHPPPGKRRIMDNNSKATIREVYELREALENKIDSRFDRLENSVYKRIHKLEERQNIFRGMVAIASTIAAIVGAIIAAIVSNLMGGR